MGILPSVDLLVFSFNILDGVCAFTGRYERPPNSDLGFSLCLVFLLALAKGLWFVQSKNYGNMSSS